MAAAAASHRCGRKHLCVVLCTGVGGWCCDHLLVCSLTSFCYVPVAEAGARMGALRRHPRPRLPRGPGNHRGQVPTLQQARFASQEDPLPQMPRLVVTEERQWCSPRTHVQTCGCAFKSIVVHALLALVPGTRRRLPAGGCSARPGPLAARARRFSSRSPAARRPAMWRWPSVGRNCSVAALMHLQLI